MLRQPGAGNDARVTAKFRDNLIISSDADVVNSGASVARDLMRHSNEAIAKLARADKCDLAMRSHRTMVAAVAGKGESGIGERKDEAAMGDALAVHHVGPDSHGQRRLARLDIEDFHAEPCARIVVLPHRVRTGARKIVR